MLLKAFQRLRFSCRKISFQTIFFERDLLVRVAVKDTLFNIVYVAEESIVFMFLHINQTVTFDVTRKLIVFISQFTF